MLASFRSHIGNPHSQHNDHGLAAGEALTQARTRIAKSVFARPDEIVLTSGATEATNLLFEGLASWLNTVGRTHIISSVAEHSSVLQCLRRLNSRGFDITLLPLLPDGNVALESLDRAIRPSTGLVSIMAANNEIGTVQPIDEIQAKCHLQGIMLHTDGAQALGKIKLDLAGGVSFASLSSHKIYGPAGIGALFVRRDVRSRLSPMLIGGGQERGIRSGTVPVALSVAFGRACELAQKEMGAEAARLLRLRTLLLDGLRLGLDGVHVHGTLENRLPGNLNLSLLGVDAEALVMKVRDRLSISTGSACDSQSIEPSHVISALGVSRELAEGAFRIGLGRFTTEGDVQHACSVLVEAARELRAVGSGVVRYR